MGSGFLNFSQLCGREGDSIPRRFRAWWGESLCQLPRLGFISRFSSANITLNGEAMCWQGPALALFQLHGIKHCRYARHRVFIERGEREGGSQSPWRPSPVKDGLVLFENHCKTKESGRLANSRVFGNNVICFFLQQSRADYYTLDFMVRFLWFSVTFQPC